MGSSKKPLNAEQKARILAELRRDQDQRRKSYRVQALKILPHVCASCGREFSGKRLRELTVHHRDHDYTHNPPDGSNWELLCLYCHDHEHEKTLDSGRGGVLSSERKAAAPMASPFEGLDALLNGGEGEGRGSGG